MTGPSLGDVSVAAVMSLLGGIDNVFTMAIYKSDYLQCQRNEDVVRTISTRICR